MTELASLPTPFFKQVFNCEAPPIDNKPLYSAEDLGREHWARVDLSSMSEWLVEIAKSHAPAEASAGQVADHLQGVAGEVGVAALVDGFIDIEVYDEEGDSSTDVFNIPIKGENLRRHQIKTVRDLDTKRKVSEAEIKKNHYIWLCYTDRPRSCVEIVGYIPAGEVKKMEKDWRTGYYIAPDRVHPVGPKHYSSDVVRQVLAKSYVLTGDFKRGTEPRAIKNKIQKFLQS